MTTEETKQLQPGDIVLVEAKVVLFTLNNIPFSNDDDVTLSIQCNAGCGYDYVVAKPEAIREKIEPRRRKFKKGDIVLFNNETLFEAIEDEKENSVRIGNIYTIISCEGEQLTLICAAENREDRNEDA